MDRQGYLSTVTRSLKFTGAIRKIGINPHVSVPEDITRALGGTGNIPVKGMVNGFAFRSTLVPVRGGPHRLYLNLEIRKGATVGVGDTAEIVLEPDLEPRLEPVPGLLGEALSRDGRAKAAWEALVPSRRREVLRYLNSLKSPDALARNVEKVIRTMRRS
jgi:hypothetical protein